ncbi:hypothetical protein ACXZ1K_05245 [Pedobacter sp. PWIIR3]
MLDTRYKGVYLVANKLINAMSRNTIFTLFFLCIAAQTAAAQNTYPWPSTGNIGIRTSTPLSPLFIVGDANGAVLKLTNNADVGLELRSTGNNAQYIDFVNNSTDNAFIGSPDFSGRILYNLGAVPNGFQIITNGDGNAKMVITNSGKIGIGTLTPQAILSLGGSIAHDKLTIYENANYKWGFGIQLHQFEQYFASDNIDNHFSWGSMSYDGNNTFSEMMRLDGSGNVAIGTVDPKGYKLAVAGNVIANSIRVKPTGAWPDFVFDKVYKMLSLGETENYIKKSNHLPGIPSAAEVKANGVDLGEMNLKLLQKIEEITLHLIEQQKAIETMRKEILSLKKGK